MIGTHTTADAALTAGFDALLPLQSNSGNLAILFVILFAIGLFLVYNGFRQWQQMRLIQDTPTEKVRSAAVGRTELSGTAKPLDGIGTVDRPFTDGEALVAKYKVEEWKEDHDPDNPGQDGSWHTIDSGTDFVAFDLDDGTGRMRVSPEADATYEFTDEHRNRFTVGGNETPPDGVVEFFERQYGNEDEDDGLLGRILNSSPSARDGDKRRYTQKVVPPGEDLYLLGGAQPLDSTGGTNAERLVLGRDEGSDEFIISEKSEEELVSGYKWAAPAQIVVGIALSAVMLFLLLG